MAAYFRDITQRFVTLAISDSAQYNQGESSVTKPNFPDYSTSTIKILFSWPTSKDA
jgi:hypothetical protein